MYLDNKYTKWYLNIVAQAQMREVSGYVERHHIIPRSLGGTNDKSNIVRLTAREHFVCHRLLTKMTIGEHRKKMIHAVWMFTRSSSNQSRIGINSRTYETIRTEVSVMLSETRKGTFNVGRVASAEENQRKSISLKGKPKSDETKMRMKEAWKLRPPRSDAHRKALSLAAKGRTLSEETKSKMSKSHKGITPTHTMVPFVCEHCGKAGVGIGNYKRWHSDNCLRRPQ